MIHWLDSDVLIQAKNKPYPFDRVPQFWIFLSAQLQAGTIRASKMVFDELTKGNDELSQWCKQRKPKGLCVSPNKEVQASYKIIVAHVIQKYPVHHANIFSLSADGWVIAHAMTGNAIVVSQEVNKTTKTTVKIPTICKAFGVKCIDTYDMLELLDFRI